MNDNVAAVADRGEWLTRGTVWLICVEEVGGWVPRQDLPPAFDEDIAKGYARNQTLLSERQHQARRFDPV